eukprot:TRINITY_DN43223_c0_g1_i1.p1 TRINITY_DN43223_c0_g1~~TRINITY_DN43223_c0_g1_i1.p1  ORF type:complete len:810 (+),score=127.13 TRINITY_DN43223_c0_g1_i1:47-2476(+)
MGASQSGDVVSEGEHDLLLQTSNRAGEVTSTDSGPDARVDWEIATKVQVRNRELPAPWIKGTVTKLESSGRIHLITDDGLKGYVGEKLQCCAGEDAVQWQCIVREDDVKKELERSQWQILHREDGAVLMEDGSLRVHWIKVMSPFSGPVGDSFEVWEQAEATEVQTQNIHDVQGDLYVSQDGKLCFKRDDVKWQRLVCADGRVVFEHKGLRIAWLAGRPDEVEVWGQAEAAEVQKQIWYVHEAKVHFSLAAPDWQQNMEKAFASWKNLFILELFLGGTRLVSKGNIRIEDYKGNCLAFEMDDDGPPRFTTLPVEEQFPLSITIGGLSTRMAAVLREKEVETVEFAGQTFVCNTSMLDPGKNAWTILNRELVHLTPGLFLLGLGNFAGVPIAYFIAKHGNVLMKQIFIPCLLVIALYFQQIYLYRTKEVFDNLTKTNKVPKEQLGQMSTFMNQMFAPRAKEPMFGWRILPWPQWRQVHFEELLEYADPFLDAFQAGSAGTILTDEAKQAFRKLWVKQGALGSFVGNLGLEGTLTLLVAVATVVQSASFCIVFYGSVKGNGIKDRIKKTWNKELEASDKRDWLNLIGTAMELSSLGLLAKVFSGLNACRDRGRIEAGMYMPEGLPTLTFGKMFCKVAIENFPSAFITISLLGYSLYYADADVMEPSSCTVVITIGLTKLAMNTAQTSLSIVSSLISMKSAISEYMEVVKLYSPFAKMPWLIYIVSLTWLWKLMLLWLSAKFFAVLFVCPFHTWSAGNLLHELVTMVRNGAVPENFSWGCDMLATPPAELRWTLPASNCSSFQALSNSRSAR